MFDAIKRFFFHKASADFDANEAFRRNQLRYNALHALDPDVLVRHLDAFARGDICGLERVLDEFERREDKMSIGAFKMAAAVASKPWEIRIRKGEEDNPRAKLHKEVLTRFWNRAVATDAFCRNRRGGLRLLVRQMMSAQSRVYSVHDIAWTVHGDGSLSATFTHVPAWCFENRTGRLRYIRNDCDTAGEEMPDGEWLVTVGQGVGVAAAILAMAKRLSWNDWLLFSEKCGMPVILGNTNAQVGTEAWAAMSRAIRAVAPKTGLLADTGTTLSAVPMGAGGQTTYRELVDTVDRAISALYRGGDLATVASAPDAAGVNAQDGESELMDADGCALVSETLRDQVERFVIRFECGDFEPLAEIVVNPPAETEDIDREIKVDAHLASLGVKLSKADALARYGRTEATGDDDALRPAQPAPMAGFGGMANERNPQTPLQTLAKPLQNARKGAGATSVPPEGETRLDAILDGFSQKLADEMLDEMAGAAAAEVGAGDAFANSTDANGAEHAEAGSGNGGQFVSKDGGGGKAEEAQTESGDKKPVPKDNHSAGKDAWEKVTKEHVDVIGAMRRQSIGDIDFVWGREGTDARNYEDGYGIAKIEKKHPGAATRIAGFIAYGDVYDDESVDGKYYIVKGRNLVVLQKHKGRNSYLVTGFTGDNPNYVKRIRKENKLIEKGEQ